MRPNALAGGRDAIPGDTRVIGYCAVFKVRKRRNAPLDLRGQSPTAAGDAPVSQNSTACESPRLGH
jgi:hypothetical protein